MKLFLIAIAGAAFVAGCAPFEHGHYANDVAYRNTVGDPPGTPLVQRGPIESALHSVGLFNDSGSSIQTASSGRHLDHGHSHGAWHHSAVHSAAATFATPTLAQPVQQTFTQPLIQNATPVVQQSIVSVPLQQAFVAQPVQQAIVQPAWPSQAPLVQQQTLAVQPVQQTLAAPAPQHSPSFKEPPRVTDIQVVPAAESFFTRNPSPVIRNLPPQVNVLATTLGTAGHRVDADGYAICEIPGIQHASHHKPQVWQQYKPRF